ncbi:ORF227 [White spot syndrome virus]|uniref:ORF227 n=1 Tax=White spot syndrome virus TaxID=342409 RepID=A0A2D3I5I5_9VIRU|nr:ORF227 [White spot syndrome virus]
MDVGKARALVGAHQGPILPSLHSLHEEIRYPDSWEKIPRPQIFITGILSAVNKVLHVQMPIRNIDGCSSSPLVSSLANLFHRDVKDLEERHETRVGTIP